MFVDVKKGFQDFQAIKTAISKKFVMYNDRKEEIMVIRKRIPKQQTKNPYHKEMQFLEKKVEGAYKTLREHLGHVERANNSLMLLLGEFDYLAKKRLEFQRKLRQKSPGKR